jgi:hypothetical protein
MPAGRGGARGMGLAPAIPDMPWTYDDLSRDDLEAATTGGQNERSEPQASAAILVLPRDDHWVVRRAHAKRVIAAFHTRDQAITRGRRIAAEADADLVIHEQVPATADSQP